MSVRIGDILRYDPTGVTCHASAHGDSEVQKVYLTGSLFRYTGIGIESQTVPLVIYEVIEKGMTIKMFHDILTESFDDLLRGLTHEEPTRRTRYDPEPLHASCEGFIGFLAFGDVAEYEHDAHRPAISGFYGRAAIVDGNLCSILPYQEGVVGKADNHPFPEYFGYWAIDFPAGLLIDDFKDLRYRHQRCLTEQSILSVLPPRRS